MQSTQQSAANEQQTTIYVMPQPEQLEFDDQPSSEEYLHEFTRRHGIAITRRRSKKYRGTISAVYWMCDRGGQYRSRRSTHQSTPETTTTETTTDESTTPETTNPRRRTGCGSRLIDCPFSWVTTRRGDRWYIDTKCNNHNHQPDQENMSGHPSVRRFTQHRRQVLGNMSASNSAPREIASFIRHDEPSAIFTQRDVYNERARRTRLILAGRSPIQALLDDLSNTDKYIFDYRVDSNNNITNLFFAHKTSLDMIQKYGTVLLMDCTYKTNRFRMPLLEVTGVTSFWTTFFCCFIFVAVEDQSNYEWALNVIKRKLYNGHHPVTIATDRELALLNAVRSVFPSTNNILCLWHIQKIW
jgi:hypothetical protein